MIDIWIDQDQGLEVIEDLIEVGEEVEVRIEAEVVDIEMIGIMIKMN